MSRYEFDPATREPYPQATTCLERAPDSLCSGGGSGDGVGGVSQTGTVTDASGTGRTVTVLRPCRDRDKRSARTIMLNLTHHVADSHRRAACD
jgi:hypothetical protein